MMHTGRIALAIGVLMLVASIGTSFGRLGGADVRQGPELETLIPAQFGNWMEDTSGSVKVVDPRVQEVLDSDYSQVVNRFYINPERYLIMLSVAYGAAEGPLKLHKPETCYSGSGFTVLDAEASRLNTNYGEIPVRRMLTRKGPREEQVMYWLRVGDKTVPAWQSKLVELGHMLTGRTPDGLVFRISSIDRDRSQAVRLQNEFVSDLLESMPPADRRHLIGLGVSR